MAELEALQTVVDEIRALGGELLAISPQMPQRSVRLLRAKGLTFEMLHDEGGKVAEAFGVLHGMSADLIEVYRGFGIDLERFNGEASWTLPMPARYVVAESGIVQSAVVDPDYTRRPGGQRLARGRARVGGELKRLD